VLARRQLEERCFTHASPFLVTLSPAEPGWR
jgi:hypothetical protein